MLLFASNNLVLVSLKRNTGATPAISPVSARGAMNAVERADGGLQLSHEAAINCATLTTLALSQFNCVTYMEDKIGTRGSLR